VDNKVAVRGSTLPKYGSIPTGKQPTWCGHFHEALSGVKMSAGC
jgi:hypothetical protein